MRAVLLLMVMFAAQPAEAKVTFDWITIDDPGNACKEDSRGCHGAVPYVYLINKFELTNAQYAEFLNAVASGDSDRLYAEYSLEQWRGIEIAGTPGNFSYHLKSGYERKPKLHVSYVNALRFANWLHNGQPIGAQDDSTTEDGAYTITAQAVADKSITRNRGARFFVTSEDEWFKAAYYDRELSDYWFYPTRSARTTRCAPPSDELNTANCDHVVGYIQTGPNSYINSDMSPVTDVGAYTNSASPYGTFDQGGNAAEWLDGAYKTFPSGTIYLRRRGGSYTTRNIELRSFAILRYVSRLTVGISTSARIARIPELEIDIDPDSNSNMVNLSSARRLISVAIVGTDEFDAAEVDPHSLEFGPERAHPAHRQGGHLEDINDDGYVDLISHFRANDTGIAFGDSEAGITGETSGGTPLLGCDYIETRSADSFVP